MNAHEYNAHLHNLIAASPYVVQTQIEVIEVSPTECRVRGALTLIGEHRLHVAEYAITESLPKCIKYRYHLQDAEGALLCRWDNAPHHPTVETFPHHFHLPDNRALPSDVRSLEQVLALLSIYLTE